MELWATWSSGRCPCSWQGGWNQMIFKVPSNPNHSMILWFYVFGFCLFHGNLEPGRAFIITTYYATLSWSATYTHTTEIMPSSPVFCGWTGVCLFGKVYIPVLKTQTEQLWILLALCHACSLLPFEFYFTEFSRLCTWISSSGGNDVEMRWKWMSCLPLFHSLYSPCRPPDFFCHSCSFSYQI